MAAAPDKKRGPATDPEDALEAAYAVTGHARVPWLLALIYVGVLVWGLYYLVANFRGPASPAPLGTPAPAGVVQSTVAPGGAGEAETAAADGVAAAGRALFVANGCVGCHGEHAEGSLGPQLAGTQLTFDQMLQQLRTPRAIMPPFPASRLSDEQARQIYDYLRSLK